MGGFEKHGPRNTHKTVALKALEKRKAKSEVGERGGSGPGEGGGVWHKALVSDCLPLAAPIGLSPLHIRTLCGSERVLVVSTEPPDDLSCLTTPGVGCPGDGAVARAVDQGHPDARWGGGGLPLTTLLFHRGPGPRRMPDRHRCAQDAWKANAAPSASSPLGRAAVLLPLLLLLRTPSPPPPMALPHSRAIPPALYLAYRPFRAHPSSPTARDALEGWGSYPPPPSSRAPSLRPATVPLTPSASLNGICNRQ